MTTSPSLEPHASIAPLPEGAPVRVCILDGWGAGAHADTYNAVASADTPVVDKLKDVPGRYRTIKVRVERTRGGMHGLKGPPAPLAAREASSEIGVLQAFSDPHSNPSGL